MKPYIVALSGGIASGKSTVEKLFAQLGVPIVDADIIAHQVVAKGQPALAAIARHFGEHLLQADGSLNRSQLRQLIFNDESQRQWLNQLLHPIINQQTQQQFAQVKQPYLLWVVPLLVENNLQKSADRVLIITTDPAIQLERLQKRDNIDKSLAEKMLSSQASNLARLAVADDIIDNNQDLSSLTEKVQRLHKQYLQLSQARPL